MMIKCSCCVRETAVILFIGIHFFTWYQIKLNCITNIGHFFSFYWNLVVVVIAAVVKAIKEITWSKKSSANFLYFSFFFTFSRHVQHSIYFANFSEALYYLKNGHVLMTFSKMFPKIEPFFFYISKPRNNITYKNVDYKKYKNILGLEFISSGYC